VFEFLLVLSDTSLCSVSACLVKIFLLVDALQLLMLYVMKWTYLDPELFPLFIFYNLYFLIIIIFIVLSVNLWFVLLY
jgi:hypothetical protein